MKWLKKNPQLEPPTGKRPEPLGHDDALAQTGLTLEERVLWRHVGQSVEPLKVKLKPRVRETGQSNADMDGEGTPPRRPLHSKDPVLVARDEHGLGDHTRGQPPARPGLTPPLAAFDPRKAKKLGNGRAIIDARLDLHGLRQDEALGHLRHFLRDCSTRGLKTVLVITGKGRETDDAAMPFYEAMHRYPRGVLRRNVPRWLDEPELRELVVSYTTAAQRHGGDGAFYVELRRRHR